MSKPMISIIALAAAGVLAVAGALYLSPAQDSADAHFGAGKAKAASIIFLPPKVRPEERIIRHPHDDGSAVDDVWMRDGTTKRITYDTRMALHQVAAYFKGPNPDVQGPLMYEKTHDANGHLFVERHLRVDGSLEMDGQFNPDTTYVRHLYYPAATPGASSLDPKGPVVSAEQTFDKWWHPTTETAFRPDGTRKLLHTWGDGLDEMVSNYGDDGKAILNQEGSGRGKYYKALYYPDGVNIQVEALNTHDGTTFQWYRPDHSLKLKVTLTNSHAEQVVLTSDAGKPLVRQVWNQDMNQKQVDGKYPLRLDHLDHFNGEGNVDSRYDYDRSTGHLNSVTFYQGDTALGARVVYTVGLAGDATSIQTYDADDKSDGDKPVTSATAKRFVLEAWMVTYPSYQLPALKDGISLYGQQYIFHDMY